MAELDRALEACWTAARLHPFSFGAQRSLANILERAGRQELAACVYARAWVLDPHAINLKAQIDLLDLDLRDDEAFDDLLLRGIMGGEGAPSRRWSNPAAIVMAAWIVRRARRDARRGKWRSAEIRYRAALRLDPYRVPVLVQSGHALRQQGKVDEALHCYREALMAAPRDADIYLHVGHSLKMLDRPVSALAAYLTAWRLKPGFPDALREIRQIRPDIGEAVLLREDRDLPFLSTIEEDPREGMYLSGKSGDWRNILIKATAGRRVNSTMKYLSSNVSLKI